MTDPIEFITDDPPLTRQSASNNFLDAEIAWKDAIRNGNEAEAAVLEDVTFNAASSLTYTRGKW